MENKIMRLKTEQLYATAEPYMAVICGYHREREGSEKIRRKAMAARERYFADTITEVLYMPFGTECIQDTGFRFGQTQIPCRQLSGMDRDSILGGYVFLFHAPMINLDEIPVSEAYMIDSWQTSFVDTGRDMLRELFLQMAEQSEKKKLFITDTIAPGMFGIAGDQVPAFFEFLDGKQIGISLTSSGMMDPVKSFVGIFLILDRESIMAEVDCRECLSNHKGCAYCRNYAARLMKE